MVFLSSVMTYLRSTLQLVGCLITRIDFPFPIRKDPFFDLAQTGRANFLECETSSIKWLYGKVIDVLYNSPAASSFQKITPKIQSISKMSFSVGLFFDLTNVFEQLYKHGKFYIFPPLNQCNLSTISKGVN